MDPKDTDRMYAFVDLEETKAEREGIEITADNTSLTSGSPTAERGGGRRSSSTSSSLERAGSR